MRRQRNLPTAAPSPSQWRIGHYVRPEARRDPKVTNLLLLANSLLSQGKRLLPCFVPRACSGLGLNPNFCESGKGLSHAPVLMTADLFLNSSSLEKSLGIAALNHI